MSEDFLVELGGASLIWAITQGLSWVRDKQDQE